MKVLVTGGAGFIGSHIVDKLVADNHEVTVVDNLSTGRAENIAHQLGNIKFIQADINDTVKMTEVLRDTDAVLHQAAVPSVPRSIEDPLSTHVANAMGTLSVLMASREAGVERIVMASSSSVYGDTPVLPKVETMTPDPLSPYAAQKLAAEIYARIFHSLFGLKTIALRYFNVFGPRQNPDSEYSAVIPKFIKLMKSGQSPKIYGDGEHTRDFTYVDNVVSANILALSTPAGFGETYNIAGGKQISLNQLIQSINSNLGTKIEPEYLTPRSGDIKDSFADINKAEKVLGFSTVVPFDEGLRRTITAIS